LSPFRFRPTLFCRGGVATEMIIPIRLAEKRIHRDCRTGLFLTVMTGYCRLAPLRISLLPPNRIRRDRNPSLGFMAHGPETKFVLWSAYSISTVALRWRLNAAPRQYFNRDNPLDRREVTLSERVALLAKKTLPTPCPRVSSKIIVCLSSSGPT